MRDQDRWCKTGTVPSWGRCRQGCARQPRPGPRDGAGRWGAPVCCGVGGGQGQSPGPLGLTCPGPAVLGREEGGAGGLIKGHFGL